MLGKVLILVIVDYSGSLCQCSNWSRTCWVLILVMVDYSGSFIYFFFSIVCSVLILVIVDYSGSMFKQKLSSVEKVEF